MRIAVGGIHTECSTYSPVLMAVEDFRVLRGAELLGRRLFPISSTGRRVSNTFHFSMPRAVPGGPVLARRLRGVQDRVSRPLRARTAARRALSRHPWRGQRRGMEDAGRRLDLGGWRRRRLGLRCGGKLRPARQCQPEDHRSARYFRRLSHGAAHRCAETMVSRLVDARSTP